MPSAVDYASELIEFDSVSSKTNVPITDCVQGFLKRLNFETERLEYNDASGIRKAVVLGKLGSGLGGLGYFSHTDVVPANDWLFDDHGPMTPTIKDGRLYGRGSCDMKGSIACMLSAAEQLSRRSLAQPLYFCCTADEEIGMEGARRVTAESQLFQEMVNAQTPGIIGEPTMFEVIHGHKGGCSIVVTAHGVAAHSSTKESDNANWKMVPFLSFLTELNQELETEPQWQNVDFEPPSVSMNMILDDFTHAMNITPAKSVCTIYFRPPPRVDGEEIVDRCRDEASRLGLEFDVPMRYPPMYVAPDTDFIQRCLKITNCAESKTVSYGTDGAEFGALRQLVILGPGDIAQAHTHDEWISLEQLDLGTQTYARMIEEWCLL